MTTTNYMYISHIYFFFIYCLPYLNTFEKLYFYFLFDFATFLFFVTSDQNYKIRFILLHITLWKRVFSWQGFSRCLLRPSFAISCFLIENFKPKSLLNSRGIICTNSSIHTRSNNWHYLCLFSCLYDIIFVSINLCLICCDFFFFFLAICAREHDLSINFSY